MVRGSVTTFDARLQSLHTNTEMATSALTTDVNDLRARIIPDLHRDLQTEIQASTNTMIQGIDTTIQQALAQLPEVLQGSSSRPPPADTTEVPVVDIHAAASTDGPLTDGDRATDPTLHATMTRGGDNVDTADATAHGVCCHHLRSPFRGTQDMRCRDTVPHITPGGDGDLACRSRYDGDPSRSHSYESHPPPLNTTTNQNTNGSRALKTSHYDMATLAHSQYYGGPNGATELTIEFIHECGYDSISVEAPEDILICYNDIILVQSEGSYQLDKLSDRPVWP